MTSLKDVVVILTCLANMIFIVVMHSQVNRITDSVTFDIDQAREQFHNETRSLYVRGCMEGTNYPPEWKTEVGIFNKHSSDFYCEDNAKKLQDYLDYTTYNFARQHSH